VVKSVVICESQKACEFLTDLHRLICTDLHRGFFLPDPMLLSFQSPLEMQNFFYEYGFQATIFNPNLSYDSKVSQ